MSIWATPCTHFDTPEGRWALVSEFTTEDAANQFVPHLAPRLGGDDLGTSASEHISAPPTPVVASSAKFSAAGATMAGSGIMFADMQGGGGGGGGGGGVGALGTRPAPPRPAVHLVANRPTFVMAFHSPAAESSETSRSAAQGSSASESGGSRGHGFRQGLKGLRGSGGSGNSNGAADASSGVRPPLARGIVSKSTSAFVSRIITSENLARWIINDSGRAAYILFNAPRSMVLVGMQQQQQQQQQGPQAQASPRENCGETLARLDLVNNTPLCHDVNQNTRSESRLDTVMGFVQGNMVWYDAISGKYVRLNKNSGYIPAIMCVRWIPGSDSLFMAGTADGGIMIMDCTKEEFCMPDVPAGQARMDMFAVVCPQKPKCNPVVYWKMGSRPITSIAFAPDGQHVAVTSEDGGLRIIDYLAEDLEDVYLSYFGGLSCCAWSDDGKYVVAGGKDDLISIWSYYDQCIVARCQGHESWVSGVVFDPMGHEDDNTYRFMSVGDDARLLVWDFSLAALHHPRAPAPRTGPLGEGASQPAESPTVGGSPPGDLHLRGQPHVGDAPSEVVHCRMPEGSVAVLQPLISEAIHDAPLSSLHFSRDLLVTACRRGVVKVWKRPAPFDLPSYL
ncbi:hypothetical protein LPJ61_005334 [Coemansia biformis]|uniref:WD40 repeat-like protein n=1 Tax=Coemansia biformis TaxID=1286918 RepID=A0A9W8CTV8_9FUNG|nr:hypothetical protein LPJ61_005334 [Coemansia biformis]